MRVDVLAGSPSSRGHQEKSQGVFDTHFPNKIRIFFYIQGLKRHRYAGPGKINGKYQGFGFLEGPGE